MWDDLLKKSKAASINIIEMYVFWDQHEPVQGQYYFGDNLNVTQFLRLCQQNELYVNFRIGPYVDAEWDYGGIPEWVRELKDVKFRDYNETWLDAMESFVAYMVDYVRPYFASQGGPIVLAQIENEYGWIEAEYGDSGKKYAQWAADFANSLDIGVPWIMCQQNDISTVINTCNGFYCDNWISDHVKTFPDQPSFWTEAWAGWYQDWGQAKPTRPVQDIAFAVCRWVARGGTLTNYYMWHGGTNFERYAGGPFIVTSYDYDVALDEYGVPHQPKYDHLKALHQVLEMYGSVIVGMEIPQPTSLGSNQEAYFYFNKTSGVAFLCNIDSRKNVTVTWNNHKYLLTAWSVVLVGTDLTTGVDTLLFDTSQIEYDLTSSHSWNHETNLLSSSSDASSGSFDYWAEPIGVWNTSRVVNSSQPLEMLDLTHEDTDYLWYVLNEPITISSGTLDVSISNFNDIIHFFLNDELLFSARSSNTQQQLKNIVNGQYQVRILCMTSGLIAYGDYFEQYTAGISPQKKGSKVIINGKDYSTSSWDHQVGIEGEVLQIFTPSQTNTVPWTSDVSGVTIDRPMTWFRTFFDVSDDVWTSSSPLALDLSSMGRGFVWVNGYGLGRHWSIIGVGDCLPCDYRGPYEPTKCRKDCDQPSQQYYHVPRSRLTQKNNLLVVFEETGGDFSSVQLVERDTTTFQYSVQPFKRATLHCSEQSMKIVKACIIQTDDLVQDVTDSCLGGCQGSHECTFQNHHESVVIEVTCQY